MRGNIFALVLAATPAVGAELHYGPLEDLERIDVQRLNGARKTIDMAAYILTDRPVIGALLAAAYRGVKVRVYLDGDQAGHQDPSAETPFGRLLTAPNVIVKQKKVGMPIMHLKSYCIDGRTFRTGSANFSASALRQQDNDLLLFDEPRMCSDFTIEFDEIWNAPSAE